MTKRRILVVEDDEFVQGLLATLLEETGFSATRAGTARELRAACTQESFDLVLLDLGLPDEDGLVTLRKLRSGSNVPVIVLTHRKGLDDRLAALEIGADNFVTKPVDPRELILRVSRVIDRSTAGRPDGAVNRIVIGP
jgi:DNA-binding response OmpR family regulator